MTTQPKFEELTRDVDWQRASLLKYCVNVVDSDAAGQGAEEVIVQKILGGYLTLALLFYKQFRADLRKHYETLSDIEPSDVKLRIQEAMDKLVEEWYRVYAIIAALRARRANEESKRLLKQMDPFIDEAMRDVALSRKEFPVILEFGQSYSLRFSNYSDDFAALSIPLWVLESPWEWTVLWHELAGEKVRKLENDNPKFFTSMYQRILVQLDEDQQLAAYKSGWSIDWLQELFEDSFSVIHFPIHFLIVFRNLLRRYPEGGVGQRHPASAVRLANALCLHMQLKRDAGLPEDIQSWGPKQWNQWTELQDEKQPDRFKSFDPKRLSNPIDATMVQLVAKEIFDWHHENKIDHNDEDVVFEKTIARAIIDYAREGDYKHIIESTLSVLANKTSTPQPEPSALPVDSAYSTLCKIVREKKGLLEALPADVLEEHPHVAPLLDGLGYKELLGLSFSKVDFHNINDIHLSHNNVKFWVDPTNWHNALFDAHGNSKGKFLSYDGKPEHLHVGFIEIQQLGLTSTGLEIITLRWQAVQSDWDNLQKKTT